ncbi:MAG TPA: hypothetical protein VFP70_11355 [Burkholderiales bacterium]|nr:hypothetical protein [Burkholderiales bacterium]
MNAPADWGGECQALAGAAAHACEAAPAVAGPGALAREIAARVPQWRFRELLCRGGWYRIGGVVAPSGERVSDNVEDWAAGELEARGGDLAALWEDFAGSGLRPTRLAGRTHLLVAPTGEGPEDFLQLEIEELQEVMGGPLFDRPQPPESMDQLVDPRGQGGGAMPLGPPRYALRRVVHVGDLLSRERAPRAARSGARRFLDDWAASSAQRATLFCNHWALAIREHADRHGQMVLHARPLPALQGEPAPLEALEGARRLALHDALRAFDRRLGYPFAWYFHMLTTKAVPFWVARQVMDDAREGYACLPERDLAVVHGWLRESYGF